MKPFAKSVLTALLFSTIASPALAINLSAGGITGNVTGKGVSANIPSSVTGGMVSGNVSTANGGSINANITGVNINGVNVNNVVNSIPVYMKLPETELARIKAETMGLPDAYVQQMIAEATKKYNLTLNNGATKSNITGLNGAQGGTVEIVTKKVSDTPIPQDTVELAIPKHVALNINVPFLEAAKSTGPKGIVRSDVAQEDATKTLFYTPTRYNPPRVKATVTF